MKVYAPVPAIKRRLEREGIPTVEQPDGYDTLVVYPPRNEIDKYSMYRIFPEPHPLQKMFAKGGKIAQYQFFETMGIPFPQTTIYENKAKAMWDLFEKKRFPVVVKKNKSSGGRGVWLVEYAYRLVEVMHHFKPDEPVIVQEVIDKGNRDARVVVYRGDLHVSYWRVNNEKFQTNVAQGAKVVPCRDADVNGLAVNLSRNNNFRLVSWDIIKESRTGGLYVLECQFGFGTKGIEELGRETDFMPMELERLKDMLFGRYKIKVFKN